MTIFNEYRTLQVPQGSSSGGIDSYHTIENFYQNLYCWWEWLTWLNRTPSTGTKWIIINLELRGRHWVIMNQLPNSLHHLEADMIYRWATTIMCLILCIRRSLFLGASIIGKARNKFENSWFLVLCVVVTRVSAELKSLPPLKNFSHYA